MPVTPATFSQAISRHSANLEPRRQSRLEEFVRDGLLDDAGEIVIGQSRFHPADVLQMMKPEEYDDARIESERRYYDTLAQTVCESFPSPIARPFDAFVNGPREPLRRLFFMRDAWEAAVAVVHGILLAECAAKAVDLSGVLVRRDDSSNPTSVHRRDLLDWSIATRLGLVEGILIHAEYEGINLTCSSVIPIDVVSEMRQLNRVRNEFSHSQTKSSRQAEQIIEDCKDDLLHVLGDLQELESVDLFRIERIPPAGNATLEVERLAGYAGARRIRELVATPEQVAGCVSKTRIQNFDRVLAKVKSDIYDASPFFYCSDDVTGHRTRLYVFKQHKPSEARIYFEAVAESEARDEADGDFLTDIGRIRQLIK